MKLVKLPYRFTICKVGELPGNWLEKDFCFISKTDEELSLVCREEEVPEHVIAREDGWRGIRIEGILDFSLVGILAGLSALLAKNGIGLFAISTYNTDYVFIKEEQFERAMQIYEEAGYEVV